MYTAYSYILRLFRQIQNSFRHCLGKDVKETGITISYASSQVLYGFDCRNTDIIFDAFTFEVTEGLELIGEYPFEHNINDDVRNTSVTSKGRLIHRDLSDGFLAIGAVMYLISSLE